MDWLRKQLLRCNVISGNAILLKEFHAKTRSLNVTHLFFSFNTYNTVLGAIFSWHWKQVRYMYKSKSISGT